MVRISDLKLHDISASEDGGRKFDPARSSRPYLIVTDVGMFDNDSWISGMMTPDISEHDMNPYGLLLKSPAVKTPVGGRLIISGTKEDEYEAVNNYVDVVPGASYPVGMKYKNTGIAVIPVGCKVELFDSESAPYFVDRIYEMEILLVPHLW